MLTVETGMAARSLAGHDKGQWYLILRVEGKEVWLIDGRTRTKDRPKKKNIRHIQPARAQADVERMDDGAVVAYIKRLNKEDQEEKMYV